MKKIVQQNDPVLRAVSKKITHTEIQTPEFKKIVQEMFDALTSQKDGVALAAPQIGYSKRLFIVSSKIFESDTDIPLVFINPKIIKKSSDKKNMEEGCLSCRWWYGKTKRASRTTVDALDENGHPIIIEGKGLLSQIFQHEIDHLDGILFLDHATKLHEVNPEPNEQK